MAKLAIRGGQRLIEPQELPQWPQWSADDSDVLLKVLHSGKWSRSAFENSRYLKVIGGESYVAEFEKQFTQFIEAEHGVAVCNGTVGLEVALRSLNIGAGDEVIVPAYTAFATISSVLCVGARPVFVDVDARNGNIDPRQIEYKVTLKTKAIIIVHFGGIPCQMEEIISIVKSQNIYLLEDASHAHGSQWRNRNLGCFGNLGVFSFHQSKNLSCGEGGMVVTNDPQLAKKVKSIHDCGRPSSGKWFQHQRVGTNARLTEFQAALGISQLKRMKEQIAYRQEMIKNFLSLIQDIPFLKPAWLPHDTTSCSFHILLLRFDSESFHRISRHRLIAAANAEGLPCWSGYPHPINQSPFIAQGNIIFERCPNAEQLSSKSAIWIDHYYFLAKKELVHRYADVFWKISRHFKELMR